MTFAVPERKLASAFVLLLAAVLLCLTCAPSRAADAFGSSLIEPTALPEAQPEDPAVNPATAPQLTVSGQTLRWTAVRGATSYVLARKVPGQADQYPIVSGTSTTPAAVPGRTVVFAVRTNVSGSVWSREVSIAYPTAPASRVPVLSLSGQTLRWTAISGVATYLVVRRISGQADRISTVQGTSATPTPTPGTTVRFAVRTDIAGSAWSNEVSIAFAGTTTPPPPPPPPPPPGRFVMGVTTGTAFSYELPFITSLGAGTARLLYDINTSASSMAAVIDAYARAGVRPLLAASFPNRVPSTAESQNVATWARAYGPGGTFWQGKTYPANTTVNRIEFGHETSYSYQWSNNSPSVYASRAQTYALRFKDAQIAVKAANPNVGLLAQGDNAVNQNSWIINMFRAVPDLGSRAAGWTIHPYGPNWKTRIDSTINTAKSVGSPDLPIWVTEWGLTTDNGRCLSDNYGYGRCLTYAQAASTLHTALTGMVSTYGSRLGAFFLYQAHDQTLSGTQTGREYYFGALQQRGQAKGAYTTEVRADLAAHRP